jgi:hypothetical protein
MLCFFIGNWQISVTFILGSILVTLVNRICSVLFFQTGMHSSLCFQIHWPIQPVENLFVIFNLYKHLSIYPSHTVTALISYNFLKTRGFLQSAQYFAQCENDIG